jgi:uncharacterized OB-fold protein
MKCLNCGCREVPPHRVTPVCDTCLNVGEEFAALLRTGITVTMQDGTSHKVKLEKPNTPSTTRG